MLETTTDTPAQDVRLLLDVLRLAPDGVVVVEARDGVTRIVFANATVAALLRRHEDWALGRPLADVEVEAPADPNMTATGIGMRVRLKRVDGTLVDCERWAVMLQDARVALYYRPVPRNSPGALAASLERTSGLSTEDHLLDMLGRDWSIGQRDGRTVTLMRFEIDCWREYREIFGRIASDNVLRQVGRTIAAVTKRASDVVAKTAADEFLVLGVSMEPVAALGFAEQILARIRSLSVHHPRSSAGRFLSVSAGVVTVAPPRDQGVDTLLHASADALHRARTAGGNQAIRGEL
ncbi:MAG TPA: GGDEF domain-containing protein [Steroidobacteraceae bacterium]|nr:GGDEF domain-containing protein [Steroidobacteraceae bacterium]